MTNKPHINFSEISAEDGTLELGLQVAAQSLRVNFGWREDPDWPYTVANDGFNSDSYQKASSDPADLKKLYKLALSKGADIAVLIAAGTGKIREWYICQAGALYLHSSYDTSVPAPKEKPLVFNQRGMPDIRPAETRCATLRQSSADIRGQIDEISYKIGRAEVLKSRHQTLLDRKAESRARIRTMKATAFINDVEANTADEERLLTDIAKKLEESAKQSEAASGAIQILEEKRARLEKMLPGLKAELAKAESKWLSVRREHLFEELRRGLYDLHSILARIIAIESHGNFDGIDKGWRFVEAISSAVPLRSEFHIGWMSVGRPHLFPGFSHASEALEAELTGKGSANV